MRTLRLITLWSLKLQHHKPQSTQKIRKGPQRVALAIAINTRETSHLDKELTSILVTLFFIGFVVFIVGLIIVVAIIQSRREKERTEQLQRAAGLLGWQFVATAPMNWIPHMDQFTLFAQGHGKSITNMMYGEIDGVKAALFDYKYTVGHGKNSVTHRQSVVYFESRNLSLPLFSLRPEGVFHKLISALGYQDIDFGNRPEFSKRYLLRGPDEPAVRNAFSDAALGFYEMNPGTSTDGGGSQLFIFRHGPRTPPLESQAFVNWGLAIKNLFGPRW